MWIWPVRPGPLLCTGAAQPPPGRGRPAGRGPRISPAFSLTDLCSRRWSIRRCEFQLTGDILFTINNQVKQPLQLYTESAPLPREKFVCRVSVPETSLPPRHGPAGRAGHPAGRGRPLQSGQPVLAAASRTVRYEGDRGGLGPGNRGQTNPPIFLLRFLDSSRADDGGGGSDGFGQIECEAWQPTQETALPHI